MLRITEVGSNTDVGRQRNDNEDSFLVESPLFVVADGMGGAQAGEVASRKVVDAFTGKIPFDNPRSGLAETIQTANSSIHELATSSNKHAGMGTTVTAAYVADGKLTIAHVGDSRAYLFRDSKLTQLTRDHSLVAELVEQGRITEDEAEVHPQRSVITRALGPDSQVEVDVDVTELLNDDLILLCSDGLTGMITEEMIVRILLDSESLPMAVDSLIAAANAAGGRDNITAVLFRLSDRPEDEELVVVERQVVAAPEQSQELVEKKGQRRVTGTKRKLLIATLTLVIVVLCFYIAYRITMTCYFVEADKKHNNEIALCKGLPYHVLGISLYKVLDRSDVKLDQIPNDRRLIFTNHKIRSRKDALDLFVQVKLNQLE